MIVVVVAEREPEDVIAALKDIATRFPNGDVIAEVRLDAMTKPDADVFLATPLPVIATFRRKQDGGLYSGDEDERLDALRRAALAGARFIDLELDILEQMEAMPRAQVIASYHDLQGTPEDLDGVLMQAAATGARYIKIATKVRTITELLRLQAAAEMSIGRGITIGLGSVGFISRVLVRRMASAWTYALYRPGALAPSKDRLGLPTLEDYLARFATSPSLPEPVASFGVLSDRAGDSIGPWVFNRVFRQLRIPAVYVPLDTPDLVGLRDYLAHFRIRGISVTTPFKEAILNHADKVHPLAAIIGAANTLVREGEGWVAYNTDYRGVLEPIGEKFPGKRGAALVVGPGGAGRAAILALKHLGFQVTLTGRSLAKVEEVAARMDVASTVSPSGAFDVVVQATPAGGPRSPETLPVPQDLIQPGQVVLEMNYGQTVTPLERLTLARGGTLIRGTTMYAVQARHQLHLFWAGVRDVGALLSEVVPWAIEAKASS